MTTTLKVNKPNPFIPNEKVSFFAYETDVELNMKRLEASKPILITEFYHQGLSLLKELKQHLSKQLPKTSFQEQRAFRAAYRKRSNFIVMQVVNHQLVAKKSPSIGWLKKLYPDEDNFYLTFSQIQGLNSAWQWYKKGISIPVLRNKIHPYYDTYFPTRFDHLILFDNWLKRYTGPKKSAMDIGFGCGVLSLQMIQHGFQKVYGTEINPNAIIGLKEAMGETKLSRKIELDFGHLFAKWEKPTELIVFNPPWLPMSTDLGNIDEAIYYNEQLFPAFFEAAQHRLLPEGKLLFIFSNLAEITNLTKEHPVKKELAAGGKFVLEKCYQKKVKAASKKTKRNAHWRSSEVVELWVLTLAGD